jgi:chemosensory pili system protein ChpA (sensor histidine kinase/response regulator)
MTAPPDALAITSVLVVSDNPSVREELEYGFPAGVSVSLSHDARDASVWLRDRVPSVVVVDLQTGNAGGFGLARDMDADARLHDVPLVMLLDRVQDSWLAQQAGAEVILIKPATATDVLRRLESLA